MQLQKSCPSWIQHHCWCEWFSKILGWVWWSVIALCFHIMSIPPPTLPLHSVGETDVQADNWQVLSQGCVLWKQDFSSQLVPIWFVMFEKDHVHVTSLKLNKIELTLIYYRIHMMMMMKLKCKSNKNDDEDLVKYSYLHPLFIMLLILLVDSTWVCYQSALQVNQCCCRKSLPGSCWSAKYDYWTLMSPQLHELQWPSNQHYLWNAEGFC